MAITASDDLGDRLVSDENEGSGEKIDRPTVADQPGPTLSFQIYQDVNKTESLSELAEFRERVRKVDVTADDPRWFVRNDFGCRFGGGSKEMLDGIPVDPKANHLHRYALQYLADQGILRILSRPISTDTGARLREVIATAVGYFSVEQGSFNKALCSLARVERFAIISMEPGTQVSVGQNVLPELGVGTTLEVNWMGSDSLPSVLSGRGIVVVFGWPSAYNTSKNRLSGSSINANVKLSSRDLNTGVTLNRKCRNKSAFEKLLACPDCRRPVEILKQVDSECAPSEKEAAIEHLVTVVCDELEAREAIDMGQRVSARFPNRVIAVTDPNLISEEMRRIWPVQYVTKTLGKWTKRRGLQDYSVPEDFVSPILFPKGDTIKDTMYSMVRALGLQPLWGHKVWLIEPSGENGVEVTPSKGMYDQMLAELRDWTHPCHKSRNSAIGFVHEWIRAYA